MKFIFIYLFLTSSLSMLGQMQLIISHGCNYAGNEHRFDEEELYGFVPDTESESAVKRIISFTGLSANFSIKAASVSNAEAVIDGEKRYLLYSQSFMLRTNNMSDWAAISILAHEIGHHLSSHTLSKEGGRKQTELEADKFSGFALYKMGATLEQAQLAIQALVSENAASKLYPPKSARLAAIANGWIEAKQQESGSSQSKATTNLPNDMVFMQGGTFTMAEGSIEAHSKTIDNYYISNHELTFAEYDAFCEATGRKKPKDTFDWGRDSRPVVDVSWYDAVAYCNWRSEQEGLQKCYTINSENVSCDFRKNGYRLPTEAEWEYAARSGGGNQKYAGTNKESDLFAYANYNNILGNTLPVKSKFANAKGLFDMSGNVSEWCWDWFGNYSSSLIYGVESNVVLIRVYRGGSCFTKEFFCASTNRSLSYADPTHKDFALGFRLCRTE